MEGQDNINVDSPGEEEMDSHPEPSPTLEEFRKSRGFRRRMSESAREIPSEGLSRLARLGNGIRRRLSGSTRDVSTTGTTAAEMAAEGKSGGNGLRRHLSASMKDLLLNGDAEGLGRRLSRRLSLLAGTVASRADNTRGSLRARLPNLRRSRTFTVTLVLPDSSHRTVVGEGTQTVGQAIRPVAQELRLVSFALALADSHAEVDLDAPAHLLDGDTILLQDAIDSFDPSLELEPRLRMAVVMAATERTLVSRLRCVDDVYGQHLQRLSSVSDYEHQVLFDGVAPILQQSQELLAKLDDAITNWSSEESCLGTLFSSELWEHYSRYLDHYLDARR
ncbi:hypothetical protein OTU49_000564 [Cherax quadricarinatus]|uniref:Uncharacterized protein n=1 Tax=Cherax quadricarinatus TaxID=27406 RepID=A0AAW0XJU6_CHEQU